TGDYKRLPERPRSAAPSDRRHRHLLVARRARMDFKQADPLLCRLRNDDPRRPRGFHGGNGRGRVDSGGRDLRSPSSASILRDFEGAKVSVRIMAWTISVIIAH